MGTLENLKAIGEILFYNATQRLGYLFREADDPEYCSCLERLLCRLQGHPEGPIWQNSSGLEPDMRCRKCGDLL